MQMKKVLYPARIERNNLGDILINALLVRELLKKNQVYFKGKPDRNLYDLIVKNNPNSHNLKVIKEIDVNSSFLWTKIQTLRYLCKYPKFYLVFDTPGHISQQKSQIKSTLKGCFEILKIFCYKFFGVKYVKYGITLGPFSGKSWFFQKYICKLSDKVVVRDHSNYLSLTERKLENIVLKPDLAYLLTNNKCLLGDVTKERINNDVITISLRGSIVGKAIDVNYFKKVCNATIELINQLSVLKTISVINIAYQVDADKETSMQLECLLKEKFKNIKICLVNHVLDFESALNLYKSSEIVITNRLHVFLFSMACYTKTYIVTDMINHKKLISIVSDLDLQSLIYTEKSLISWHADVLEDFLIKADKNKQELQKHISTL
jgi:polysaccharide pyruvyl transferase WcaK-like protein